MRKEGRRLIAGVGFAMQEVESVPLEETDERLDVILTEKELLSHAVGYVGVVSEMELASGNPLLRLPGFRVGKSEAENPAGNGK